MADKRLYVGDLPSDTTEHDLQKFFKKYEVSAIELKRKSGLQEGITFAYVNIRADKVDDCLQQCRSKSFKNTTIKIEAAKESFLDRLKKERDTRNEVNSSEKIIVNRSPVNNNARKNKKIVFNDDDDDDDDDASNQVENSFQNNTISPSTTPRKRGKRKLVVSHSESRNESDHSGDEVPRKHNLPMFRGTSSVRFADKEESKIDFSMKRFEEFSDVWRDSSPEKETSHCKKLKWKWNEASIDSKKSEDSSFETEDPKQSSKNVADRKRVDALQEKWNVMKEKKETIKKALRNLKFNQPKVKFPEPDEKETDAVESKRKKLVLFEEDASDDDFQANFNSKEYLDGKNGLELLKLKSKLSNDERFKLNDRFYEEDEVQRMENSRFGVSSRLTNENEQRKELLLQRSMIRYDPAKEDHKLLEKQLQSKTAEKKKKVKKKPVKTNVVEESGEKNETPKPEVSKAKHYAVADSLKDAFKKTNENKSFSLSALFDEKIQKDKRTVENVDIESVSVKKLKSIENPFENTSESEENDEEPFNILPTSVSCEKVLGKCGVWGETFFFKLNDSRLEEAVSFYKVSSKPKHADFNKARCNLKSIVRKKLQNSRRDRKLFKRKLGGRLNNSKFQKRLKKARS